MQLAFLTFLPSIDLSGLLFPIEGVSRSAEGPCSRVWA
jgi:hypothetical protein